MPAGATPLPKAARPYGRTDEFTEKSVPAGLRKAHTTKDGTWALIHVLEGELAYRIVDTRRPKSETILTSDTPPGVVEPTILHEVEPLGTVRFYVEFHRQTVRRTGATSGFMRSPPNISTAVLAD